MTPPKHCNIPIDDQLDSLARLKEGWDDGCGEAYPPESISAARSYIKGLVELGVPNPYIYPNSLIGYSLEWDGKWPMTLRIGSGVTSCTLYIISGDTEEQFTVRQSTRDGSRPLIKRRGGKDIMYSTPNEEKYLLKPDRMAFMIKSFMKEEWVDEEREAELENLTWRP